MKKFVFTCGDINGIGPEIAIKALNKLLPKNKQTQFVLIIPKNIFETTSKLVEPKFEYVNQDKVSIGDKSSSRVIISSINSVKQNLGSPTSQSGKAAYDALKKSYEMLQRHIADAVVTAPVSKTALKMAGVKYPGQTEMFADWCGTKNFVMTFLSNKLRVGLYSIHIPLIKVSKSLNSKEIKKKLEIIYNMLKYDLGISNPKIAVLGLNPHAGENGIIGDEEKKIIIPAIGQFKYKFFVDGPFSSDAFFANRLFKKYDLVFGFYHDQVLIPFKYINSGKGVNFSAGLPIIRTSPDHGVAYDIAGKGIADESSMIEAFNYAKIILKNRRANTQVK
jgi:4-hydroxythreonine-4-phosphate dehydrogenase